MLFRRASSSCSEIYVDVLLPDSTVASVSAGSDVRRDVASSVKSTRLRKSKFPWFPLICGCLFGYFRAIGLFNFMSKWKKYIRLRFHEIHGFSGYFCLRNWLNRSEIDFNFASFYRYANKKIALRIKGNFISVNFRTRLVSSGRTSP